MCSIPPETVEAFLKGRWKHCPDFDYERVNYLYPVKKFFDQDLNDEIIQDLMDQEKLICLIKKRGNFSAPGLDGITFPFLKLEKEAAAKMILVMMKLMLKYNRTPEIWKLGKTILIFKAGDPNDPGNWRPITLTSVVYRIIFGRISQSLLQFENRSIKRSILIMSQKCFVPRVN
jgi:hypothetical protein